MSGASWLCWVCRLWIGSLPSPASVTAYDFCLRRCHSGCVEPWVTALTTPSPDLCIPNQSSSMWPVRCLHGLEPWLCSIPLCPSASGVTAGPGWLASGLWQKCCWECTRCDHRTPPWSGLGLSLDIWGEEWTVCCPCRPCPQLAELEGVGFAPGWKGHLVSPPLWLCQRLLIAFF